MQDKSYKEQRIRKITSLYYSKPEIQKAIFNFSINREVCPRYFEGFGKRPDSFQYPSDVFEMAKRGATSFHCSEEIWEDPIKIKTGMSEEDANNLRIGWDLLIDIDCKWIEFSKLAAKAIINVLRKNNVNSISIKFSGSKGFHILVPFKTFPKEIAGQSLKDLFPEIPKKLILYLRSQSQKEMQKLLPDDFYEQFKDVEIKKGVKCNNCGEIAQEYKELNQFCEKCNQGEQKIIEKNSKEEFKCPNCKNKYTSNELNEFFLCNKCNLDSRKNQENFSSTIEIDLYELMGLDLVLVSPRHLFRAPYSLHEKTALSSIVLEIDKLDNFDMKDADPLKIINIKDFYPDAKEGEAKEFVMRALDWYSENAPKEEEKKLKGKYADFKPVVLKDIQDSQFPPCIKKILNGVSDGKKRAVFVLINFFRSVGMNKEELEKRIFDWNQKNKPPLKTGYIKSQLLWSYKKKPIMPPNCREFYQGIGVCAPDNLCNSIKNPINYLIRKNRFKNKDK